MNGGVHVVSAQHDCCDRPVVRSPNAGAALIVLTGSVLLHSRQQWYALMQR